MSSFYTAKQGDIVHPQSNRRTEALQAVILSSPTKLGNSDILIYKTNGTDDFFESVSQEDWNSRLRPYHTRAKTNPRLSATLLAHALTALDKNGYDVLINNNGSHIPRDAILAETRRAYSKVERLLSRS